MITTYLFVPEQVPFRGTKFKDFSMPFGGWGHNSTHNSSYLEFGGKSIIPISLIGDEARKISVWSQKALRTMLWTLDFMARETQYGFK